MIPYISDMAAKKRAYYKFPLRLHLSHKEDLEKYAEKEKISLNDAINIGVGLLLITERQRAAKSKKND